MTSDRWADLEPREHFVYVIWQGDVALYVGATCDWEQRLDAHGHYWDADSWSPLATHIDVWEVGAGRTAALALEAQTIRNLDPVVNVTHSPRAARLRAEWDWYSDWLAAYNRSTFDLDSAWARDPAARARAEQVLLAHGWSVQSATAYGFLPEAS